MHLAIGGREGRRHDRARGLPDRLHPHFVIVRLGQHRARNVKRWSSLLCLSSVAGLVATVRRVGQLVEYLIVLVATDAEGLALVVGVALVRRRLRARRRSPVLQQLHVHPAAAIGSRQLPFIVVPSNYAAAAVNVARRLRRLPHVHAQLALVYLVQLAVLLAAALLRVRRGSVLVVGLVVERGKLMLWIVLSLVTLGVNRHGFGVVLIKHEIIMQNEYMNELMDGICEL